MEQQYQRRQQSQAVNSKSKSFQPKMRKEERQPEIKIAHQSSLISGIGK
jgi:hypothetical protein